MPTLQLMRLRADQRRIVEALRQYRIVVLAMGRRWGKTVLGEVLCVTFAARGGKVAWVVPTYKNGRPLWRMIRRVLAPLSVAGVVRINEQDRTAEFDERAGGGLLAMYSGEDNCDAMRGEDFDLVVVDEAAKLSEMAWTDAIQPTLADRDGRALVISTPRGQNWFWREWMRGQDTTQQQVWSTHAPSSDNPNPKIQRAAELARERIPARSYRQEWLAEFIPDGGEVFRNVDGCVAGTLETAPAHATRRYVMGVDLAKMDDYTVCCVADVQTRRLVAFERFHLADWPLQKARILVLAQQWNNAEIWLDSTGIGSPIYDDLARAGARIHPYTFTAASKTAMYDNAILLVEQQKVGIPDPQQAPTVQVLINELKALIYKKTPAGNIRIEAPSGMHDDCCTAFGLMCLPLAHEHTGLPASAFNQVFRPASDFRGLDLRGKVF